MKTDIIHIDNQGVGFQDALEHTAKAAQFRSLTSQESLRLRLLTEEMLGMLREITGQTEALFWIESEGKQFELHLLAHPMVTGRMREELLSVSSSGKNAAAVGVMGKIRDIFECAFDATEIDDPSGYHMQGLLLASSIDGIDPMTYSANVSIIFWSMKRYRKTVAEQMESEPEAKEKWDELEKSIMANLADEVSISIRGKEVEMVAFKDFAQK